MDRDFKIVVTDLSNNTSRTIFFSEFALQRLLGDLKENRRGPRQFSTQEEQLAADGALSELVSTLLELSKSSRRRREGWPELPIGDIDLSS